jgi:adenosylcobinamide kinase/adenosylcobinamide-phosphate guanylyltransferase
MTFADSRVWARRPPAVTLVLGGARSGKSRHAERLIEAAGGGIYLATAEVRDEEMRARIDQHQSRRGQNWRTIEEAAAIAPLIASADAPVLLDCLTLWLSNLMERQADIAAETDILIESFIEAKHPVVLVSNEVGLGIVPMNPLARRFRDEAGRLNQTMAEIAGHVVFLAAGLPLSFKDPS